MIRVLHLVSHMDQGGLEQVVANLVERATPSEFESSVLCLSRLGFLADRLGVGERAHLAPRQSRLSLLHPRRLAEEISRFEPDVVNCHTGVWLKGARAASLAGVGATIYTEHGRRSPDPRSVRLQDGLASLDTDVVVAVTPELRGYLERSVVARGTPIRVIENGTDVGRFGQDAGHRASFRQSIGVSEAAFVIGTLGRLVPIKAYDTMVQAFATLVSEHAVDAHLAIGGEGDERASLEQQCASLGVRDRVTFLGWRNDTAELLPGFDVFSLTSLSEGTSIALLEAMASGVCPVVTDVGGNARVLGPDLDNGLVPVQDAGAIARRWAELADDRTLRTGMAALARRRVETAFSLDSMVDQYEALYRQVTGRSGRF